MFQGITRRRTGVLATRTILVGLAFLACKMGSDERTVSGAEQVLIGDIRWYVDYEAAVEIAREQDKALWVHFGENPG